MRALHETLPRTAAQLFLGVLIATIALAPAAMADQWHEGFDGPFLEPGWSWIREDPEHWSLTERPGSLRVLLQTGGLYFDYNNARNVLLQPAPDGDYAVEIYLEFSPQQNFQKAGILFYQDDDNLLFVGRAFCDESIEGCIGDAVYFDIEEYGELDSSVPPVPVASTRGAYLRLEKLGREFTAKYSPDGDLWTIVGSVVSPVVPVAVGIGTDDSDQGTTPIAADFDFFILSGDSVVGNVTVNPHARAVEVEELEVVATTWVRTATADARPDAVIERIEPYQENGKTYAYIAHLEDGGYCITGADALVLPVYLYSASGSYEPENPSFGQVLSEVAERTRRLRTLAEDDPEYMELESLLVERAATWADLSIQGDSTGTTIEPVLTFGGGPSRVILPLTSQWSQGSPYNRLCPVLPVPGAPRNAILGCVAVSMAQVMYYWQWPSSGEESGSADYEWRSTPNWIWTDLAFDPLFGAGWANRLVWQNPAVLPARLGMNGIWDHSMLLGARRTAQRQNALTQLQRDTTVNALNTLWGSLQVQSLGFTVDFSSATYDWDLMEDVHVRATPAPPGNAEVAKLAFHAAVAQNTNFGVELSTAGGLTELVDFFRYDDDLVEAQTSSVTLAGIIEELQWMRPVEFSGGSPRGGHSWLGYGYDTSTDQFLMNMGWGGNSSRVWLALDQASPLPTVQFVRNQWVGYRMAPKGVVRFVGSGSSGDGSPSSPYHDIDAALADATLPDAVTLIFKAGSMNEFAGSSLVIKKPMTLKGIGATIGE